MTTFTLCWDCRNATNNGCSWSRKLKPVKGWDATPTEKREISSYQVNNCPKFVRDSWGFGLYRTKQEYTAALEKRRAKEE